MNHEPRDYDLLYQSGTNICKISVPATFCCELKSAVLSRPPTKATEITVYGTGDPGMDVAYTTTPSPKMSAEVC